MTDSKEPENPSAFPDYSTTNGAISYHQEGMTLHDRYAIEALGNFEELAQATNLPGEITNWDKSHISHKEIAKFCHKIADAMLSERERGGE